VTLLPVKISSKPFFSEPGTIGDYPEIIYISDAWVDSDEVVILAGLGDTFSGWARIKKSYLQWSLVGVLN
jgi:hypothetical protein